MLHARHALAGWLSIACAPYDPVVAPKGEDLPDPETDTDGGSVRPRGPNPEEEGLVTAWQQLVETRQTTISDACTDQTTTEWRPIFEPPDYGEGFYYLFFRVAEGGATARNQDCAGGYPQGCVDRDPTYAIEGHTLTGVQPEEVDLGGGCLLHLDNVIVITDRGDTGTLSFGPVITYTGSCPAEATINDACSVAHAFDLTWADAR